MDNQGQPARRSRLAPEPDFLVEDMAETPAIVTRDAPTNTLPSDERAAPTTPPTTPAAPPTERRSAARVVVTDIHMSFSSMVVFLVKLTFAIIPAALISVGIVALFVRALGWYTLHG